MQFPVWEIPWVGAELPRALVGHALALAAHVVAGSSLLMVLLEHRAQREGNQPLLSFLQNWSRFGLFMTAILGAGLAAGLWFVVAVTQPWAAFALARVLFWVWGIVWVLGAVALAGTLLYYSGWGVTPPGHHLAAGWIVAGAAWLGLFTLTGIQAFLLDPAGWLKSGELSDGFFNPAFNPALLMHTGLALGLGGLFLLVAATEAEPLRLRGILVRAGASFACLGFLGLPAGAGWEAAVLPATAREALRSCAGPVDIVFWGGIAVSCLLAAFAAAGPLTRPEGAARPQALLMLALGLGVAVAFGWTWQAARGPHVAAGWLEANGLQPGEIHTLRAEGFLANARWATVKTTADAGRAGGELFRLQCAACHTLTGHRGLLALVRGWDQETLVRHLDHLPSLRGAMPPFAGSAEERRALARWLVAQGAAR